MNKNNSGQEVPNTSQPNEVPKQGQHVAQQGQQQQFGRLPPPAQSSPSAFYAMQPPPGGPNQYGQFRRDSQFIQVPPQQSPSHDPSKQSPALRQHPNIRYAPQQRPATQSQPKAQPYDPRAGLPIAQYSHGYSQNPTRPQNPQQRNPSPVTRPPTPANPNDFWGVGQVAYVQQSSAATQSAEAASSQQTQNQVSQPAQSVPAEPQPAAHDVWSAWPTAQAQTPSQTPQQAPQSDTNATHQPTVPQFSHSTSSWHAHQRPPSAKPDQTQAPTNQATTGPGAVMDLQAALRVLKKTGYSSMAGLIEEDCSRGLLGQSDSVIASVRGGLGPQLMSAARRLQVKENPVACFKNFLAIYGNFWNWTLQAADSIRQALREVAFVVFIELWTRLLTMSVSKAEQFLKKFGEAHYPSHHDEILEMRKVTNLAMLRDCPFVMRVLRGEKFHLKVDILTRKLLTTRLALENETVIMDILQKRVSFDVSYDGMVGYQPVGSIATLTSFHWRNQQTRDLGAAIVTPSLAVLCGLPLDPLDETIDDRIPKAEPTAKVLQKELLSLYRLPLGNHPGLEWRHRTAKNRRYEALLGRDEINLTKLPSIVSLDVNTVTTWPGVGKSPPAAIDVISLERDHGRLLGLSDRNSRAVWVFDLQQAQWSRCTDLYRRSVFNPWLLQHAQHRAKDPEATRQEESNQLESSGVTVMFEGKKICIPGPKMDQAFADIADSNAEDVDAFMEKLNEPALRSRPYKPKCLAEHDLPITGFEFLSPFLSGGAVQLALSTSYDGRLCLWDVKNAFCLHSYRSGSPILSLDADAYGYLYLTGHVDRAAVLWCMDRPNPLRVLNRHGGQVEVVKVHQNSVLMASGSSDDRIRLWDSRTPDIVGLINGVMSPRLIEFAPNGRYLALSGSRTPEIHVWDLVAGKMMNTIIVGNQKDIATSLAPAHGSELIACTTSSGLLQLWDLCGTGKDSVCVCFRVLESVCVYALPKCLLAVSRAGRGIQEPSVAAADLCVYDQNAEVINSLKDTRKRGCLLEYDFNGAFCRKSHFTTTNLLLAVTESGDL